MQRQGPSARLHKGRNPVLLIVNSNSGAQMIDSGRFNSAREHMDDLTPAHLPAEEDAALAAVTESVVSAPDIGTSTMFDLGQIDVSWDADAATLWAFMTPTNRPNYSMTKIGRGSGREN